MSRADAPPPTLRGAFAEQFDTARGGQPIAAISFVDGDGARRSLADFRGRVILLNLWATWCGPCKREMPELDALQARLGGDRFLVLALSQDRGGAKVIAPYFRANKLDNLAVYVDGSLKSARALGVPGLPTTILIDRGGNEVGRVLGIAKWTEPQIETLIRYHMGREVQPTAGAAS